ncbi:unnamed protein product [Rhizoctonia solani]|uniref:ATP-dependent DNA helicase PIF1 n=1 Tax=Rhizoctonia solani TaxID=456999 RepID=A0A8H3D746_9AGAM|nr:unnamed protein product [Rhizoctonia solani]CAE6513033.1 unnamed protein product [Rhizoctonia solani]
MSPSFMLVGIPRQFKRYGSDRFISLLGNRSYAERTVSELAGIVSQRRNLARFSGAVQHVAKSNSGSYQEAHAWKQGQIRSEPMTGSARGPLAIQQHGQNQGDALVAPRRAKQALVFHKSELPRFLRPELSEEQKYVLNKVLEGESLFFTGSAGTGKSVLLRAIIEALGGPSDSIAVTASTGIAAAHIGGQTLHSFAGVGLGHGDLNKLIQRIKQDPEARARWLKVKVLIIDEVSMVDATWFDQLEEIARKLKRKYKQPFGGIQLVICGDFFQLPPVRDLNRFDAPASFVFDSHSWDICVRTKVMLTQVFRQKDPRLVKMLNDARIGVVTDESAQILKSLARPVFYDDGIGPTELYPRRYEADYANRRHLMSLPGEVHTFYAYDKLGKDDDENAVEPGRAALLFARMIVPKRLPLKVGAQVMCLRNVRIRGLVNGSIGRVVGFMKPAQAREFSESNPEWSIIGSITKPSSEEGDASPGDTAVAGHRIRTAAANEFYENQEWPLVQYMNGQCALMTPTNFTVETPNGAMEVMRLQVPLVLAWALTVHKSQGQTLERVKINLQRTFEKGQAYVALSRCTSLDTLEVYGFDRERSVQAHPRVQQWALTLTTLNSFAQPTSSSAHLSATRNR